MNYPNTTGIYDGPECAAAEPQMEALASVIAANNDALREMAEKAEIIANRLFGAIPQAIEAAKDYPPSGPGTYDRARSLANDNRAIRERLFSALVRLECL